MSKVKDFILIILIVIPCKVQSNESLKLPVSSNNEYVDAVYTLQNLILPTSVKLQSCQTFSDPWYKQNKYKIRNWFDTNEVEIDLYFEHAKLANNVYMTLNPSEFKSTIQFYEAKYSLELKTFKNLLETSTKNIALNQCNNLILFIESPSGNIKLNYAKELDTIRNALFDIKQ